MSDQSRAPGGRGKAYWGGWGMSGLVVAFLLLDLTMKLLAVQPVIEASKVLGYPTSAGFAQGLGVTLLICTALYVAPQTAVLGAILLTGYLGGSVASHVRVGNPLFTHILFGVYVGVLLWGGLYLRDPRLRVLIPLRRPADA